MKVHLTTLGCPKNQVDSELMLGMLQQSGHHISGEPETADCLVVNTCAFIDRAREESVNTILELAQLKKRGRARTLIVTGCLGQRYGQELLTEMPEVDAVLGTSDLHRIVDLVNQAGRRQGWVESAPPGYLYDATTPRLLTSPVPYAYGKIAEGCDRTCGFCAIPSFRGPQRSRVMTMRCRAALSCRLPPRAMVTVAWVTVIRMNAATATIAHAADLLVTNTERLRRGIDTGVANSILVKVNQIGTLTETLDTMAMAREAGFACAAAPPAGSRAGAG